MENNKIIIIALIIVIIALLVGIFAGRPNMNRQDTKLTFVSDSTISEGDSIQVLLEDTNGNPLANQTINVKVKDGNQASDYHSVVTNEKGIGTLKINKSAGDYDVTVNYDGDNYNACNVTQKITIKEKVVEDKSNSESSDWIDADGNPHYYENGQEYVGTRSGQHMTIDKANYVKEHGMK